METTNIVTTTTKSIVTQNVTLVSTIVENVTFNLEVELVRANGRRHTDLALAIAFTTIYTLIFVTGLLGNVSTCFVIAKNQYMHTATNYYLFSLAVSDVLTIIICLPPEIYQIWEAYPWPFGGAFCVFKVYVLEMTAVASCLTITAFTVERYIAICKPMKFQTWGNLSRVVTIIISVWVVAALCALPYGIHTKVFYTVHHNGNPIKDSLICNIPREDWTNTMIYILPISTCVLFVGPMSIIVVLYILIGLALKKSIHQSIRMSESGRQSMTGNKDNHNANAHSRKAVVKMLVAVVVAFFMCWCPFHVQRLLSSLVQHPSVLVTQIQDVLFYVTGIMYFVSSTINPLLYNVMSRRYRKAFKNTLKCQYAGRCHHYARSINTSFKTLNTKKTTLSTSEEGNGKKMIEMKEIEKNKIPTCEAISSGRAQEGDGSSSHKSYEEKDILLH